MAEVTTKEEEKEKEQENDEDETEGLAVMEERMSRKEKRKALKKAKRKEARRERAAKERLEAEAKLNDPAEQARLILAEQEEAERSQRERAEFEERERAWLAAMEENQRKKAIEEEEERRRIALDEASRGSQQAETENEGHESDGDWEYVEEGPPEIIWQGNEIILKKKRIKVSKKKELDESSKIKNTERPISNPFPPESETFPEYRSSSVSRPDLVESVALQVPNFGTEQDKAHCPFHLKTGVCRFGQRCSRVHFYPDKSCTLLIKSMYNGPGLAWEQDEGLEYTEEEVERCYEEFYEDVHTEFLKFGEIVNFKVCRNGSFHLRGNVYIQFKALDSAVLAYQSVNGRYFAGKQISCTYVNVARWKVAICGEYMKTKFKTCSRGTACNFIHCFRNPAGEYEWADSDKPPPRYWVKKMIALFGFSDHSAYEGWTGQGHLDRPNSSLKISSTDEDKYHSRRSRSREKDYTQRSSSTRVKDDKDYVRRRRDQLRCRNDDKDEINSRDENVHEDSREFRDVQRRKRKSHHTDTGESLDNDGERSQDGYHDHAKKSSRWKDGDNKNDGDKERGHGYTIKSFKYHRAETLNDYGDHEREHSKVDRDWRHNGRDEERYHDSRRNTSRHSRKVRDSGDPGDSKRGSCRTDREWSDNESDGDRHSSRRKSLVSSRKPTKPSDDRGRESNFVDSYGMGDEWSDKDSVRHIGECSKEASDLSDEGDLAKRLNIRDHSRKKVSKTSSGDKGTRSGNGLSCSSEYEEDQCRFYDLDSQFSSDVEMGKLDRWEPEKFPERHDKHGSKKGSHSRSPGRYKSDRSRDKYSEVI